MNDPTIVFVSDGINWLRASEIESITELVETTKTDRYSDNPVDVHTYTRVVQMKSGAGWDSPGRAQDFIDEIVWAYMAAADFEELPAKEEWLAQQRAWRDTEGE